MHEPLKNQFGPEVPRRLAGMIRDVNPSFPSRRFLRRALDGYDDLELTPRAWRIADALGETLPARYPDAAAILVASLGPPLAGTPPQGMSGFLYLPYVFFVARNGLNDFEVSMAAQYELTRRFTAEFSIRGFIERDPDRTLGRLREWTSDQDVHVRRLVSEGTRPRLPWAPRLRGFMADPSPVLPLLELLRDDPELYVRRSVANNLNDIAKDHPTVTVDVCRRWIADDAGPNRAWLVRHALRTLTRRGHPGALAVLGFSGSATVSVRSVSIEPQRPSIGDAVNITCEVANDGDSACDVLLNLRVHFVKANGSTSPKVFALTAAHLGPGEAVRVAKRIALHQQTTRTHHPGAHRVDLLVNGLPLPLGGFDLVAGDRG